MFNKWWITRNKKAYLEPYTYIDNKWNEKTEQATLLRTLRNIWDKSHSQKKKEKKTTEAILDPLGHLLLPSTPFFPLFTWTSLHIQVITTQFLQTKFDVVLRHSSRDQRSQCFYHSCYFFKKLCMTYYHLYNVKDSKDCPYMHRDGIGSWHCFLGSIMFSPYFLCYKLLTVLFGLLLFLFRATPTSSFISIHLLAPISLSMFYCQQTAPCLLPFILVHLHLTIFFLSLSHF